MPPTSRARRAGALVFSCLLALLMYAGICRAGVELSLLPTGFTVEPGDSFLIELTIPAPADSFNGYDAVIGYDPALLTFLQEANLADQEGPLMVDACPSIRFHRFSIAPDSTSVTINHVLLCGGVKIAGPGVLYRLRFVAKDLRASTTVEVLPGTQFYDGGLFVNPLLSHNALIRIGTGTAAPPPVRSSLRLRAAPNPFNPRTTLSFSLPSSGWASLRIYGADGRLVRILDEGLWSAGLRRVGWNGRDGHGRGVASGLYTARLVYGIEAVSVGLVLLK